MNLNAWNISRKFILHSAVVDIIDSDFFEKLHAAGNIYLNENQNKFLFSVIPKQLNNS